MIPQSTFCDGNLRRALERLGRYQRPQASLIYSWISIYFVSLSSLLLMEGAA